MPPTPKEWAGTKRFRGTLNKAHESHSLSAEHSCPASTLELKFKIFISYSLLWNWHFYLREVGRWCCQCLIYLSQPLWCLVRTLWLRKYRGQRSSDLIFELVDSKSHRCLRFGRIFEKSPKTNLSLSYKMAESRNRWKSNDVTSGPLKICKIKNYFLFRWRFFVEKLVKIANFRARVCQI